MLKRYLFLFIFLFGVRAQAQSCPGTEDEAAFKVKTDAGPILMACGYEDHEVKSPPGQHAFTDFGIFWWTPKATQAQAIFTGEPSATYWLKGDTKGMTLTALWFFSEKPEPAWVQDFTCEAETCKLSAQRCVLKIRKAPYPKALAKYQKKGKQIGDEGEDVMDQILAQALSGDAAAAKFYEAEPQGMDPRLSEVFDSNQRKIKLAKDLKCQLPK